MAYNNYNKRGGNSKNHHSSPRPKIVNKEFYNPYSFVPFAEHVYSLSEEEKKELDVIQEVPVDGSLSGKIEVNMEAQTPFCVRKGNDDYSMNVDGRYYVPGTTLKGMFRGVFEILAYCNARNGIANNRYSMRDLRSNYYELKANEKPQKGGFLLKLKGKYYVQNCKYYSVWTYKDIEDYTEKTDLKRQKTAADKYKMINRFTTDEEGNPAMWFFSGFMNNKEHEFMFTIPEFDNSELHPIEDDEWQDFVFIHETENDNKGWKFWKRILKNYNSVAEINAEKSPAIVPCFFRTKEDGFCVKDLGFSYLYRQPYSKKIHDFLPSAHSKSTIDLAQAMFGYVDGSYALKGRVQFAAAFIKNAILLSKQTFTMGSPKPTYYPFYLQQDDIKDGKLNTYFNKAKLSGAKRYVLQSEAKKGNDKYSTVTTSFYPIDKGAKFTSTIYFHNLHDYELGALLAAITFCNNPSCYHSLGYAKPLGYGRMKVTNCSVFECESCNTNELIDIFKEKIANRCGITIEAWEKSVTKLFKIASTVCDSSDKQVRYPIMNNKEFENIKNQKYKLSDFEPCY